MIECDTQEVSVNTLFDSVAQQVHETLPQAYFQSMVFSGKCQDLPRLQGTFVLVFVQVRPAFPQQQVVRATALVDTTHQTMDIYYEDVSKFYPSTKPRDFGVGSSFQQIAAAAYQHITELGLCDGDVTITQLDDSWDVRCGSLDDFIQKCRFEIKHGNLEEGTR